MFGQIGDEGYRYTPVLKLMLKTLGDIHDPPEPEAWVNMCFARAQELLEKARQRYPNRYMAYYSTEGMWHREFGEYYHRDGL
jgi:hypothetical protein